MYSERHGNLGRNSTEMFCELLNELVKSAVQLVDEMVHITIPGSPQVSNPLLGLKSANIILKV